MKKLLVLLVLATLLSSNNALSQNIFDSRFMLGNSASLKLDHFHDWQWIDLAGWTSFVEVSPTGKYALLEFGPKINIPGGALKLRAGLNISAPDSSRTGAKYVDQQALVLFLEHGKFQLLSVNEIKDIARNKIFHWAADQYYYEHDFKYNWLAIHVEAVWWEKNYKPFTGPTFSFPVGSGHLVVWPGWQIGQGKKILAVEYNLFFK
ncbi:MAG: hypothetical protein PHZ04_04980 [Patescibacteria group bacterium]|nr:hypothetical protein [Patescibacteria group bacterium]MDD5294434.1 hypothetical protein [Patescibacteria group bacterium]MDD5554108.1 hypothetical protein [Patescibacteria group bacterium]